MIALQVEGVARTLRSAALLQAHAAPLDSISIKSPLPGGVKQVVRFLLTTVPAWVQIAGMVLAVIVGIAVLWFLFRHRSAILQWVKSRSRAMQIALAATALVLVASAAVAGTATWNYTQHSNDFCVACHVMDTPVERMIGGTSKHSKLSCHSCHQQPIQASISQLYVWVSERPEKIEKHAVVPNEVCEKCHVTQDTAVWQRIASTAGHRVHLESDSSSLKNIKCVTCHGKELHRFLPASKTCAQSECHLQKDVNIVLGKMSGQTILHCTGCHEFAAAVPLLATGDSATNTLVPGAPQCLGCHQMRKVIGEYDSAKDPHGGKCGTCHNPHTQKTPAAAGASCAACHTKWREEPFHSGENHKRTATKCLTCHLPHQAKVDASDCQGCHQKMRTREGLSPPVPFDTAKALKRADNAWTHTPRDMVSLEPSQSVMLATAAFSAPVVLSGRDAFRQTFDPPFVPTGLHLGLDPPRAPPPGRDGFPHSRHEKLSCLVCHETGIGQGRLTFERPRGCAICHHQAPSQSRCASCHRTSEYAAPIQATATVTVPGHAPKGRPVEFRHAIHSGRACLDCHTTPVTMAPSAAKAECRDCHQDHHSVTRNCSTCHSSVQPALAHKTPETSHQRCDACHTAATVAQLTPTRNFCSTCHAAKAKNHYDLKECTTCHFLAEPSVYRQMLSTRAQ